MTYALRSIPEGDIMRIFYNDAAPSTQHLFVFDIATEIGFMA